MDKEKAIKALNELLDELNNEVKKSKFIDKEYGICYINDEIYEAFRLKTISLLKLIIKDKEDESIKKISDLTYNYYSSIEIIEKIIKDIKEYIEKDYIVLEEKKIVNLDNTFDMIFGNFHKVVKKMRNRYDNRETLDVKDEYDVQDLLFAILQIFFKDIRKEEWTPSYAGNSSRVDFLLKDEKVVIEVKKTRESMKDKDLGEQLIIDIAKYKSHPDCKNLICFVYDPDGRIVNPDGIIKDLEKDNKDFVKIYINP